LRDQDSTAFNSWLSLVNSDTKEFEGLRFNYIQFMISNVFYFTAASSSQKGNHHDRRGVVNYEDDDLFG